MNPTLALLLTNLMGVVMGVVSTRADAKLVAVWDDMHKLDGNELPKAPWAGVLCGAKRVVRGLQGGESGPDL
jgi:hypothetical protein